MGKKKRKVEKGNIQYERKKNLKKGEKSLRHEDQKQGKGKELEKKKEIP